MCFYVKETSTHPLIQELSQEWHADNLSLKSEDFTQAEGAFGLNGKKGKNKGRKKRNNSSLPNNSNIDPSRSASIENMNKKLELKDSHIQHWESSEIVRHSNADSWDDSVNDDQQVEEPKKETFSWRIWLWDGDYYEEQALHSSTNPLVSPWSWSGKQNIIKYFRNNEIYSLSLT